MENARKKRRNYEEEKSLNYLFHRCTTLYKISAQKILLTKKIIFYFSFNFYVI